MKPILLVGEARGEVEARMNSSFVGPYGVRIGPFRPEFSCCNGDIEAFTAFADAQEERRVEPAVPT